MSGFTKKERNEHSFNKNKKILLLFQCPKPIKRKYWKVSQHFDNII